MTPPSTAEQERAAITWQPIETAPKDGRRVLVYMPEDGRFDVGPAITVTDMSDLERVREPTYWMPLPAPPVDAIKARAHITKADPR